MANFSAAFGYDFYIVPVQNALVSDFSSAPTVETATPVNATDSVAYTSGVFTIDSVAYTMDGTDNAVRLSGLTTASLETDTGTEDIYTYDDTTSGFNQSVATTKSFSISLAGIADFGDAGYKILRLTEQNTVADGLRVAFKRVGPTGTTETIVGYGTLTGYTESNEVSSIVSWECTLTGYGPYHLTLQSQLTGGIAGLDSLTTTTPFDAVSGTALAASATTGGAAVAVNTDESGNVTTVGTNTPGSGYKVGDIVTFTEDGGAGVFTAEVTSIS